MLFIIDSGISNLGSIKNMLKKIGIAYNTTSNPTDLESATKIILPGVGSFDAGIAELKKHQLDTAIIHKVKIDKTPILGICLGMQLLLDSSEEGTLPGLGLIEGKSKYFSHMSPSLKVPHMGWNEVKTLKQTKLSNYLLPENKFYFVHSYYVDCKHKEDVAMQTNYGGLFTSAIQKDNIYGVQFHPEKSHKYGFLLLKGFCNI